MRKKILLIIFCCLPFVMAHAQTRSDINNLLDNISKDIDKLAKDKKLSAPCLDTVKHYKKGFAQKDILSWNKATIDLLLQHADKFVAAAQPKGKLLCNDQQIKNVLHTVHELTAKLKTISLAPSAAGNQSTKALDSTKSKLPVAADTVTQRPIANNVPSDTAESGQGTDTESASAVESESIQNPSMLVALTAMVLITVILTVLYIKKRNDYNAIVKSMSMSSTGEPAAKNNGSSLTGNEIPVPGIVDAALTTLPGPVTTGTEAQEIMSPSGESAEVSDDNIEDDINPGGGPMPEEAMEGRLVPPTVVNIEITNQVNTDIMSALTVEPVLSPLETEILAPSKQRYFLSEVMMTAGPRKKFMGEENADKDLGEDVCGFVSNANEMLIWLLDGTSDLHCLKDPVTRREYFSSRLLALGIAENLRSAFGENAAQPIKEMVDGGIKKVKENWLQTIERLPEEEKVLLKNNIEKKNFPECAATILIARLSLSGNFSAYRSGDSKMMLFSADENGLTFVDSPLDQKNDESNDRIFFRLRLDGQDKFDIIYNEPLHETVIKENISTIISFSDGIGMSTEQLLIEEYKTAPDQIRKEIVYHSQETGDDKSICFIEIKETR